MLKTALDLVHIVEMPDAVRGALRSSALLETLLGDSEL
jgi:hypothetical protein